MTSNIWPTKIPEIPKRSRLYNLEPIGIETWACESLTSYVARLAEAHCTTIADLFNYEISPVLNRQYAENTPSYAIVYQLGRFINGMDNLAFAWSDTLGVLTSRTDLHYLTMISWSNVLSSRKLLRSTRAWCPICYNDWREERGFVHDPLIWSLDDVKYCPRHLQPLQTRCSNFECGKKLSALTAKSQPGHCPYCEIWLGGMCQAL